MDLSLWGVTFLTFVTLDRTLQNNNKQQNLLNISTNNCFFILKKKLSSKSLTCINNHFISVFLDLLSRVFRSSILQAWGQRCKASKDAQQGNSSDAEQLWETLNFLAQLSCTKEWLWRINFFLLAIQELWEIPWGDSAHSGTRRLRPQGGFILHIKHHHPLIGLEDHQQQWFSFCVVVLCSVSETFREENFPLEQLCYLLSSVP